MTTPSLPAFDLVALVIELKALIPTYIDNHLGRAVQYLGLNLIDHYDPALAQRLHDDDDQKPFTASGLMQDHQILYGEVQVNEAAWVRLTGLSSEVAAVLLHYAEQTRLAIASGAVLQIELDRLPWQITALHVDADGHPWAGKTTYQALIERHTPAKPATKLELTFASATTFRSQRVNLPLPLPSLVFGSLLSRWTAFTSHRLRDLPHEQLDAYIDHHVLLSRHEVHTTLIRGKQGGKEIGFVGSAGYELARRSDHLLHHAPELENLLQQEGIWFARTLGLLAEFAFYSGVGRKTTTGMGIVKVR